MTVSDAQVCKHHQEYQFANQSILQCRKMMMSPLALWLMEVQAWVALELTLFLMSGSLPAILAILSILSQFLELDLFR